MFNDYHVIGNLEGYSMWIQLKAGYILPGRNFVAVSLDATITVRRNITCLKTALLLEY